MRKTYGRRSLLVCFQNNSELIKVMCFRVLGTQSSKYGTGESSEKDKLLPQKAIVMQISKYREI